MSGTRQGNLWNYCFGTKESIPQNATLVYFTFEPRVQQENCFKFSVNQNTFIHIAIFYCLSNFDPELEWSLAF